MHTQTTGNIIHPYKLIKLYKVVQLVKVLAVQTRPKFDPLNPLIQNVSIFKILVYIKNSEN